MTWRPSKKTIAIIVGVLILLLILWLLWPKKRAAEPAVSPAALPAAQEQQSAPRFAPEVTRPMASPTQAGVETVARTFAERYASFSSESDFANIIDLYPLMTSAFAASEEARIKNAPASSTSVGVSSKAVTVQTIDITEARASIEVGLQQTKTEGTSNSSVSYRTLRVNLVKQSAGWLVENVAWQD